MTDEPLRIAIACYPTFGGSGVVATELGLALADRGHEVHLLAYAEPPRATKHPRIHLHLVEVSAYPLFKFPPYDLALASKMRELVVNDGVQVLHAHYAIPHSISAYLAVQMSGVCKPIVVTTLHGTDITVVGSDPAYRDVTRFGLQNSDRVIAVSQFLADETRRGFGFDDPILVIPNFVDTERFRPRPEMRKKVSRVLHVSNFRPVKRSQDAVRAFAMGCRDLDARLALLGDGPELEACLKLGADLGIRGRIDVLGSVLAVEEEMQQSDILLQPSGSEAFGLAALEAMACAVPVIGYEVGGLPEVVVDGETGLLAPFRDVNTLAGSCRQLLSDHNLRERLATGARKRAVDRFRAEPCVQSHEQLYREALAR